jgi:hypothetical protein
MLTDSQAVILKRKNKYYKFIVHSEVLPFKNKNQYSSITSKHRQLKFFYQKYTLQTLREQYHRR